MPNPINLRFGAELEVVTGYRAKSYMEWHAVADVLHKELSAVGIKNHVNAEHKDQGESYQEWSLIQEVTITNQMMQNRWAWNWYLLSSTFSNRKSGTHILTMSGQIYGAKATVGTSPSAESLLLQFFDWIDAAQTTWHLSFLMCSFSKDSDFGKVTGAQQDFAHNVFRWNFTPLSEVAKGTIEFRQAPGSANASHSKLWVQFVASFIQGAVEYASSLNPQTAPTLESLRAYVLAGAQSSGVKDLSPLESLFAGKSQLPAGAYDLKTIDQDGLLKLKKKSVEKNITLAKFKKLYGYK